MQLFIDTNVFLSFYHLSSDDLEELKKLSVLILQKKVELYLPKQVEDEFFRNRDSKIADAINRFKLDKLNKEFPQICKEYPEYVYMREAIKSYEKEKGKLLEKLTKDFSSNELKADHIINELLGNAIKIPTTEVLLKKAKVRFDLGNPPGKNGSYGDALIWECLLSNVPDEKNFIFVTDDADYQAQSNRNEFSPFLKKEWLDQKKSNIIFYKRLSEFFKDKFPDIKLAVELEKDFIINSLFASPSFQETRQIISKLKEYNFFTSMQLNEIVSAAISNKQIYWIINDDDIYSYFFQLLDGKYHLIDPVNLHHLNQYVENQFQFKEGVVPF